MAQVLGPCTHVGDLEEAPCYWLWIGATLAIAANWGVNQWMEDPSLFSASLCVSLTLK